MKQLGTTDLMNDELTQRLSGANDHETGNLTVSLEGSVRAILEKWRRREVATDGKTRRESLGSVASSLIRIADELLMQRAAEQTKARDSQSSDGR